MIVKTTIGRGLAGMLGYLHNTNAAPLVILHTSGKSSHVHIVSGRKTVTKPIGARKK